MRIAWLAVFFCNYLRESNPIKPRRTLINDLAIVRFLLEVVVCSGVRIRLPVFCITTFIWMF